MAAKQDLVVLDRGNGNSVTVHLFGATVISWQQNGDEIIFVSSKSLFDNKKAIRGGIPVVFPNFGPWDLGPQHGFGRISRWTVSQQPSKEPNGDVTAVFTLEDNEETRKMWNYKFKLTYTVTVGERSLNIRFDVTNTGNSVFDFTSLLHTYFQLPDVTKTTVSGLKGLSYIDKIKGGAKATEERDLVSVSESTDRVYISTPDQHVITNGAGGRTITLTKNNFRDTVVWNPWEKAAGMADFGDEEYHNMICVEAGSVSDRLVLTPGHTHSASQTLSV